MDGKVEHGSDDHDHAGPGVNEIPRCARKKKSRVPIDVRAALVTARRRKQKVQPRYRSKQKTSGDRQVHDNVDDRPI